MESESIFEDDIPSLENTNLFQWQYNRSTETYEIIKLGINQNKVVAANLSLSQLWYLLDRLDNTEQKVDPATRIIG